MELPNSHSSEETESGHVSGTNKTHKAQRTREMLYLVIIGFMCIGGIGTGVYFAANPTDARIEGDQQEGCQPPGYMYDMESLDIEAMTSFDGFSCEMKHLKSFVIKTDIGDNCNYVFTDQPSESSTVNACKEKFTTDDNILLPNDYFDLTYDIDFANCCFSYFLVYLRIWLDRLDAELADFTFRPLQINYSEDSKRWRIAWEPYESQPFECRVFWDGFDPDWKNLNSSHQPTYSHMCVSVVTEFTGEGRN